MIEPTYKVLITASGTGSRLGELTQFVNKALVRVGKKAAISYILEQIPESVPVLITLGYKKDQVKEYLLFAHPERAFEFVEVDRYEGDGSSQGYSLLCAQPYLQCPFVYIACDTLFSMPISCPKENWIGGAGVLDSHQYTSFVTNSCGNIVEFQPKGAPHYDYAYVGVSGIVDYTSFWQELGNLHQKEPNNRNLNDILAFSEMLKKGIHFQAKEIENWLDIGNESSLKEARKKVKDPFDNLEKLDESIYLFDDRFVIKFFHNPSIIQKRIARSRCLEGLVPKIDREGKYFYRYEYARGDLYSQAVNPTNLLHFLQWCQTSLWTPVFLNSSEKESFKGRCRHFYYEKTIARLNQLPIQDEEHVINFQKIPSLKEMFSWIDWEEICNGRESGFHGDLHFENILIQDENYCLLDWRQDFDGIIEYGDTYYDLAKLNHGMIVSHDIVRKNLFKIEICKNNIECEILRPDNLVVCQEQFFEFLKNFGFNTYKVNVLTALIFLNISPLHHHPYNLFLYYFGKLRLWYALSPYLQKGKIGFEAIDMQNASLNERF